MICTMCTAAGTANASGDEPIALWMHQQCTGCVCQHKTGRGYFKRA